MNFSSSLLSLLSLPPNSTSPYLAHPDGALVLRRRHLLAQVVQVEQVREGRGDAVFELFFVVVLVS